MHTVCTNILCHFDSANSQTLTIACSQAEFVCRHYCAALRHCNALDMDDFVPTACAILGATSATLLAELQALHSHIIVDEYQVSSSS